MNFLRQSVLALCQAVKQLLRRWTKPKNDALVLNAAADLTRSKTELMLENALLRQQLIVLKRQAKRPALTWRDRALFVVLASKLRTWKQALLIVQPDTLLRWHRELFRRFWRCKSRSETKPGRPPLTDEVVALIKRMAKENHTWGAKRIRGELKKLGIEVAKSTIQRYLRDIRGPLASKQTWACDFVVCCSHCTSYKPDLASPSSAGFRSPEVHSKPRSTSSFIIHQQAPQCNSSTAQYQGQNPVYNFVVCPHDVDARTNLAHLLHQRLLSLARDVTYAA